MDKRITQFSELGEIASNDVFAVVDVSANETKKVNYQNLVNNITGSLPSGLGGSGLGWARYDDTQYTTSSVYTVTDGAAAVVLPNNSGNTIISYMNSSVNFYEGSTRKIQIENEGDVHTMVVTFKAKTSNSNQTHFDISLSSTGATPYDRVSKSLSFAKGNDTWENFYEVFHFYGDSDFVTNGNQWKVQSSGGNVSIASVIYFIQRTFNAG